MGTFEEELNSPVDVELCSQFDADLEVSERRVHSFHARRARSVFPPLFPPDAQKHALGRESQPE